LFTVDVGIVDGRRQYCGAPACNLRSLAALFHEKAEGEARGGGDHLIGAEIDGHYSRGISGGVYSGELPFPEREERKRWR
jgi:hypothetical protein